MGFDGGGHLFRFDQFPAFGMDNDADGQIELAGKFKVALVVGRHRHHGAGAVAHQHVIGNPDRDMLTGSRVDRVSAGEYAGFLAGGRFALNVRLVPACSWYAPVQLGDGGDFPPMGAQETAWSHPKACRGSGEDLNRIEPLFEDDRS